LDNGRVVEQGTHEALMFEGGRYARMVGAHDVLPPLVQRLL